MISKLFKVLSKKQINLFFLFILFSLITMALETLGIGLIIPFAQSLIGEGINDNLILFLKKFGVSPENKIELITVFISIIGLVYTLKVLYLTFFSYAQTKFLADLRVELSDSLYKKYLNNSFQFHLNNNSAKLIRNLDEISLVVALIQSLIITITESIIFFGIAILVVWYEPVGSAVVILFFGLFGFLFFYFVQKKVNKWGKIRQIHSGLKFKFISEGFRLIKFVKIFHKAKEFIKIYTNNNKIINECEIKQNFTDSLPRLWLEWLIIIAFTLLIFTMIFIGKETSYIVPLLGLFAAASYRIMPSLTRIMNNVQKIIYNKPALNAVYVEFDKNQNHLLSENNITKSFNFKKSIKLKNLEFNYSGSDRTILKNLNLTINYGETIGLIGESGKGKTTLVNIILGLLKPSKGEILVDETNIEDNLQNWQKKIGYVSQDIFLSDDTIKKNIAFGLADKDIEKEKVNKAIVNSNIDSFINNLEKGIETSIGEFGDKISGGQRQRIAIARAFYNNPEVLILDEFTNSLDHITESKIIEEINNFKRKKTIVIIAHKISTLKNCDRVFRLQNSNIEEIQNFNEK